MRAITHYSAGFSMSWSDAGLLAAEKRFRPLPGYKSMAVLLANVYARMT